MGTPRLDGFQDEYDPLSAPIKVGLIRRPYFNKLEPISLDLLLSGFTRPVSGDFRPDLRPGNRVGAQVQCPGIRALETRVDIAQHHSVGVAHIEYWCGAVLACLPAFGSEKQDRSHGTTGGDATTTGSPVKPTIDR